MKILNLGSLNIDYVYTVDEMVVPGQTLAAHGLHTGLGGKGYNQSLALARAGARVCHAGLVGHDGAALVETLAAAGVDTSRVGPSGGPSGHAVIQLDAHGQNGILVFGGANHQLDEPFVKKALAGFGRGDILLLQNETSCVACAMRLGKQRGMQVVFNPSPPHEVALGYPMKCVDLFILNEHEAAFWPGKRQPATWACWMPCNGATRPPVLC
jgi:ribokinase